MKILVLGGTGLIRQRVTKILSDIGHEIVVGSPKNNIDIITGQGLGNALAGTEVVVDLSNSTSPEEEVAINFFTNAGINLKLAEKIAGIKHHIILSIVGLEEAQDIGYLRAKKIQENTIIDSGIPYNYN